jgi:hypothetical protein
MALADLNPRSTAKYLIAADLTTASGKLLTIDVAASSTAGVAVLKICVAETEVPIAAVVVGAASDSGTYPGYATSAEFYDTLTGCFDGAIAGVGGVTAGDAIMAGAAGKFITAASLAAGDFVVGYALTDAAEDEQFTIKFNVTQF